MLGRVASWGDRNPHAPSRSSARLGVNDVARGDRYSMRMRPAEPAKRERPCPALSASCSAKGDQCDVGRVGRVIQHRPIGGVEDEAHRATRENRVSDHSRRCLAGELRCHEERARLVSPGVGIGREFRPPLDLHRARRARTFVPQRRSNSRGCRTRRDRDDLFDAPRHRIAGGEHENRTRRATKNALPHDPTPQHLKIAPPPSCSCHGYVCERFA